MTRLTSLPERALELASVMGDNLRHAVPAVGHSAGKWLETGVKLVPSRAACASPVVCCAVIRCW